MATISKIKISNMALDHVGAASNIESFAEESAEADLIREWYDYSRLQVLEAFDWSFARTRVVLALHSEAAPTGIWTFRYVYPADCVAFRKLQSPLGPRADAVPFEIELDATKTEKTILTDLEDAVGVYTFDMETTSFFSSLFVDALSYLLGHHIAYSISGKLSLKDRLLQDYNSYISWAPTQNANEAVDRDERNAVHIRARD